MSFFPFFAVFAASLRILQRLTVATLKGAKAAGGIKMCQQKRAFHANAAAAAPPTQNLTQAHTQTHTHNQKNG